MYKDKLCGNLWSAKNHKGAKIMRTILVTGGTNGIGNGIALEYLAKGDRVIVVSNSNLSGETFIKEAQLHNLGERAVFIKADLSLISENKRLIEEIKHSFPEIDKLIFCASRHRKERIETAERLEFSFALDYLSRFLLSYGLKECLEKTEHPIIMNVCGTGMKGKVNWDDLQHKKSFSPIKVMMHGSRLNDLSGIAFAQNDDTGKIKYILYNPMAVKTPGMMEFGNPVMKLYYKFAAKTEEKAVIPIIELLDNPPSSPISAYKEHKEISLALATYNKENAVKLYNATTQILEGM